MNFWSMLGKASAWICVLWSLCRLYLSLVTSPDVTIRFGASKFWSHYWGCHLKSLASGQEKHSGVLVSITSTSPSFPAPVTFTVRETGTQSHQKGDLKLIQDAAITTFWEQSLGVFPNMAHLFNAMENEGFPQNYTHCSSQGVALVQASALQAS